MEHTKGEWEVGKRPPLSNWVVGVNLSDPMEMNLVANLYGNKDDAHLIAAAPDMYGALKLCSIEELGYLNKVIDKALAKAEGGK